MKQLAGHLSFSANEGNGGRIDSIPQKSKKAWTQMRFLQFVCVLAMACFPLMMKANTSKYYSQVTANVSPVGAGKVYVSKNSTINPNYQENSHSAAETDGTSSQEHTYHLYAQKKADYSFSGWYQENSRKSTDLHYEVNVNGKKDELAEYIYEARFTRLPASLTVIPQELEMEARPGSSATATFTVSGQHIYKGGVTLEVNNSAFTVSSATLTKAQAEAGATITVTYNPTANQDYSGKVTIKTTSNQSEDHITNTKFVEVNLKGYSTGYPVSIGSAGATTLYVDMPLVVPSNDIYEDLNVFYASGITENGGKKKLSLTSLNNNIPANTGVIIIGAQGEYYFLKYRGSALSPIGDNWLSGTTTGTTREAVLSNASEGSIVMTLSMLNGQLGFYKYVNDNLAANKAYLVYKPAAGSNVTYFSFGDESGEETDAISNMKVVKVDDAWYTLQGARLNGQPTQRGIYIHGGKKVIVK